MKKLLLVAALLVAALPSFATIGLPPSFSCSNRTSSGGVATVTVTCTGGTVATGDLILLAPTCQSCNTTTGLTIVPTNTSWSTLNGCTSTTGTDRFNFTTTIRSDFCWAIATSGGSNPQFQLSVTNAPASFLGMNVAVVSNSGAGGWSVDASPQSGTCSSASACATANTTTGATAFFWSVWSTDATQTCTAGTGYTTTNATANARTCAEVSTSVESAGTTRTGSISGSSANWVGFNVSFKESGAVAPKCVRSISLLGVGCPS